MRETQYDYIYHKLMLRLSHQARNTSDRHTDGVTSDVTVEASLLLDRLLSQGFAIAKHWPLYALNFYHKKNRVSSNVDRFAYIVLFLSKLTG